MGADLLQTFVSRFIQPLRSWEMTMWMYPGPSCHDRPVSTELDDMEINTRIRGDGSLLMGLIRILALTQSI
jgi:hypothetical protein